MHNIDALLPSLHADYQSNRGRGEEKKFSMNMDASTSF